MYDDQGFRIGKIARRTMNGDELNIAIVYPSMYFGVEWQKTIGNDDIPKTGYAINNIYLNGVRIAAMQPDGTARYMLTDSVDSVKVVTDDSGLAVSSFEYFPFGSTWFEQKAKDSIEDFAPKYNSQEFDKETGFYYYNARYYEPEISRFVTADNVIDGEYSTQGWNRYSYVKNNPVVYKDPTGHFGELYSWPSYSSNESVERAKQATPWKTTKNIAKSTGKVVKRAAERILVEASKASLGHVSEKTANRICPIKKAETGEEKLGDMLAWLAEAPLGYLVARGGLKRNANLSLKSPKGNFLTQIDSFFHSGKLSKGVKISKRPSIQVMEYLTNKYKVEFAVTYKYGLGRNGKGGYYYLWSGKKRSVTPDLDKNIMLIYHTHPGGTPYPSPADKNAMRGLYLIGSPQRTSIIIPLGKKPVKFDMNGIKFSKD